MLLNKYIKSFSVELSVFLIVVRTGKSILVTVALFVIIASKPRPTLEIIVVNAGNAHHETFVLPKVPVNMFLPERVVSFGK